MRALLTLLLLSMLAWCMLCIIAIAGVINVSCYPFIWYWLYAKEVFDDIDPHYAEMWIDHGPGGALW